MSVKTVLALFLTAIIMSIGFKIGSDAYAWLKLRLLFIIAERLERSKAVGGTNESGT